MPLLRPGNAFLHFLFLTAFLLVGTSASAQEFAPLGATWTYEVGDETPALEIAAIQFTADRDTVLAGRSARVIEGANLYDDGTWEAIGSEVVTGNQDSVYVWIKDSFHLIFDFTAEAGDTIQVTDQPFTGFYSLDGMAFDSFTYRIDSVYKEDFTGDQLILQHVSYLDTTAENFTHWGFLNGVEYFGDVPGQILRGVGSLGRESMLGTTPNIGYIGLYFPDRLTCYRDSTRDYRFRGVDCEALIAQYTDPSGVAAYRTFAGKVYPNPFHTSIRFETADGSAIRRIEVRDLMGRVVAQVAGGDGRLDLSHLVSGTYHVSIFAGDGGRSFALVQKL